MLRLLTRHLAQAIAAPCALCGVVAVSDGQLCPRCLESLPALGNACQRCAHPLPTGARRCGRCVVRPPRFDSVHCAHGYGEPLSSLLLRFKAGGAMHLSRTLAAVMVSAAPDWPVRGLMVPVPPTRRRARSRGFDPGRELCRHLATATGLALSVPALLRARDGPAQAETDGARARRANVRGRFHVQRAVPTTVILVDDVLTTGATTDDAARALKAAGCRTVIVWALARADAPAHGARTSANDRPPRSAPAPDRRQDRR